MFAVFISLTTKAQEGRFTKTERNNLQNNLAKRLKQPGGFPFPGINLSGCYRGVTEKDPTQTSPISVKLSRVLPGIDIEVAKGIIVGAVGQLYPEYEVVISELSFSDVPEHDNGQHHSTHHVPGMIG